MASSTLASMKKRGGIATRRTTHREGFGIETTRVLPNQMIESHFLALESSKDLLRDRRLMLDRQLSMKHSRKYHFLNDNSNVYLRSAESTLLGAHDGEESKNNLKNNQIVKLSTVRKTDKIRQFAVEMSKRPVEDVFNDFITELQDQRQKLRKTQLELYDSQWGLTPTGTFATQHQTIFYCMKEEIDPIKVLRHEFDHLREETLLNVKKLEHAPDVEIGMEILHMFILDLLGRDTPVAKIFLAKAEEDFRHSMIISKTMKGFAWFLVILLNFMFVYFSMLRGIQRGLEWQRLYLGACILQFVVEVLFYETSECVFIHFIIPDLARNEVRSVGFAIHQVLQNLWISTNDVPPILNVPSYLYLSVGVANFFPDLLESIIVRSYLTYSPGELAKKWKPKTGISWLIPILSNFNRNGTRTRYFTLTALFVTILQQLGSFSPTMQRVTIHLIQPIFISALILLFVSLQRHPLYFIIFCVVAIGLLYILIKEILKEINEHKEITNIHPIQKIRQSRIREKMDISTPSPQTTTIQTNEQVLNDERTLRDFRMNGVESKDALNDDIDDDISLNFQDDEEFEYPIEEYQHQFIDDDPNDEYNINSSSQGNDSIHQFFSSSDNDERHENDHIEDTLDQYPIKNESERDESSIMDGNDSSVSYMSKKSYQSSKYGDIYSHEKDSEEISQYRESFDNSIESVNQYHDDEWNDDHIESSNSDNTNSYDIDD